MSIYICRSAASNTECYLFVYLIEAIPRISVGAGGGGGGTNTIAMTPAHSNKVRTGGGGGGGRREVEEVGAINLMTI